MTRKGYTTENGSDRGVGKDVGLAGRRVLVIDDASVTRRILRDFLECLGVEEIHEASSGQQALEKVSEHPVDVVTMDFNLPGPKGLDLVRELRKTDDGMRILLVTGLPLDLEAVATVRCACDGAVEKPVTLEGLERALLDAERS